jgi:hypothetical protein
VPTASDGGGIAEILYTSIGIGADESALDGDPFQRLSRRQAHTGQRTLHIATWSGVMLRYGIRNAIAYRSHWSVLVPYVTIGVAMSCNQQRIARRYRLRLVGDELNIPLAQADASKELCDLAVEEIDVGRITSTG